MENAIDMLMTELSVKDDHIAKKYEELQVSQCRVIELEYTLRQLRSQLSDIHGDDSILIQIIDNKLNK
jgi:hypothetical protein|tara:strand:+ start:233 stop:436 length:204 start_codon:yes stop_codon:yes gene_type:complete